MARTSISKVARSSQPDRKVQESGSRKPVTEERMDEAAVRGSEQSYVRRERLFALLWIVVVSLTTAHATHDAWNAFFHPAHGVLAEVAGPASTKLYAPQAYRIFIPTLVRLFRDIKPHADVAVLFSVIDGTFLAMTLAVLYDAAMHGLPRTLPWRQVRAIRLLLLLFFCTECLVWVPQFARPETMPTALYVALALIWTRRIHFFPVLLASVLTIIQAFTRADVPFCLGLAMMLAGWLARPAKQKALLLLGLWVTALAGGVQLYLQLIRFPHLTYDPQTPVVMLRYNLQVHMWSNSLLAIFPVWAALLYSLRCRELKLTEPETAVPLCMGALYLPLWLTVGLGAEVRIYIPVLLMMSPIAARGLSAALGWTGKQQTSAMALTPSLSG